MTEHAILVNYNFDPGDWWIDYGFKPENVWVYDRSDDGIERNFNARTYKTTNIGDVDADKLGHLIQYYDTLPETFLWAKTNLVGRFVEPEYLKKAISDNVFTPLLKFDHKTYGDRFGEVNRYSHIYEERNDSWIFNNPDLTTHFKSWGEWASYIGLPSPGYLPFAPGGNYLLTRDRVHRYSRDLYQKMRDTLNYSQHPAEAHACERSYYLLWQ